jgi:ABC-2 type transport system permease protein
MRCFGVQLGKELRELWATRKLIIIVAVILAFGFLSPLAAKILPDLLESFGESEGNITITIGEITFRDAIDQYLANMSQMVLLLVVLMSFGVVVGERERGQMAVIFTHPVPRSTFVLAKFAALALTFSASIGLGAMATYLYTAILFETPDPGAFVVMVVLVTIYLLCLMALSLLASTLGKTTMAAGALAFGLVVAVLLPGSFSSLAPSRLLEWGGNLAKDIDTPARWGALVVALAITAGAVGLSCLAIHRQEIQ